MTNIYTWIVSRLDSYPMLDSYTDVVSAVYWSRQADAGNGKTVSISGSTGLALNPDGGFIDYSKIAYSDVVKWLDDAFGVDGVNNLDKSLDILIEELTSPTVTTLPLPWVKPLPDTRFYDIVVNQDGTYTATPKDLGGLKTTWAAQTRQAAYTLLLPSDWMIVRKVENATDVPAEWLSYREAVRTTTELAVTDLESKTDIEAFIEAVTSVKWPVSPDAPQIVEPAPAA